MDEDALSETRYQGRGSWWVDVLDVCETPGERFSKRLDEGVWNSEERSRLEVRVGVHTAFEAMVWNKSLLGELDRPQGTLHLGHVTEETEASMERRIGGGDILEARAGARGGHGPQHQHHREVPNGTSSHWMIKARDHREAGTVQRWTPQAGLAFRTGPAQQLPPIISHTSSCQGGSCLDSGGWRGLSSQCWTREWRGDRA